MPLYPGLHKNVAKGLQNMLQVKKRLRAPNDLHWQWDTGSAQPTGLWDSRSPLHTRQGESGRKGGLWVEQREQWTSKMWKIHLRTSGCLSTDALSQQLHYSNPPPLPFLGHVPHRHRVTPSSASLSLECLSQLRPCRLASSRSWIFPFRVHHRVISHFSTSLCELHDGAHCLATVVSLTLSIELWLGK